MKIQELQDHHLSELLKLYTHLHNNDQLPTDQKTIRSTWLAILQNPNIEYFGVFEKSSMVASCHISITKNLTRGCRSYGLIENVVTHSAYRRKGHGKAILAYALKYAWDKNCYKVMLLTGRMNEETFKFYESAGFDRNSKQAFVAKP